MIGFVSYLAFFLTMAAIFAIAVLGLNLQWGYTGLFNGGVVAFFGAGAYATMILGGRPDPTVMGGFELPFLVAVCGGILAAGLLAWIVGILTLRLRHDYLAIATFGVAIAFESVTRNAEWLTGAARGLRGFPRPFEAAIGNTFVYNLVFLAFVLAVLVLVYLGLERLVRSPFGRALRAIRDDETASRAVGKDPTRLRLTSFVLGAMIMGIAGALYVTFYAFVSPQDLAPILTFQIWAMLIVGGAGNNRGAILGAFAIWAVWTASGFALSRFAPQAMQIYSGSIQFILIGSIIVGMLLWRPQGLLPERLERSAGARRRGEAEAAAAARAQRGVVGP
ncbi:branched-chain amino acid ABC transporter permease [Salinarimonas sp.]|uniref:branched-chain amino acid ABC transporter permease n=1 Tax=Salinarimonas sp. TaxID=2766526 RepID=UPI0039197641